MALEWGSLVNYAFAAVNVSLGLLNVALWRSHEKYKSELRLEHDKALLLLKYEYHVAGLEKQYALGHLQQKRAEALDGTYKKLVAAEDALKNLTKLLEHSSEPSKRERAEVFVNQYNELEKVFKDNRIYFEPALCQLVDKVFQPMRESYIEFSLFVMNKEAAGTVDYKKWNESFKTATDVIGRIRLEVEAEFRRILGIKDSVSEGQPSASQGGVENVGNR